MLTKSLTRVQIKDADQGMFTAAFSAFNVIDKDGDVTLPGAFTNGAPVVVSGYGHTSWEGALPIGKGVIRVGEEETFVDGQFFMGTTHGKDAFTTVKELSDAGLQEWSYSLQNVVAERGEFNGQDVRFLKSINVKEVSPVLVGAGTSTRTTAIKSVDLKFSDHVEAVLTALDEVTARALEVVTLRAEQGKQATSVAGLADQLIERAAQFKQRITELTTTPDSGQLRAEFARFVAITQGVTIP